MKWFLFVFLALFPIGVFSQENEPFRIKTDTGRKLWFRVVSEDRKEVVLARRFYRNLRSYVVPQYVTYNGVTYTVVGISDKAFHELDRIRKIELPQTIKHIGKEAFEDCRFKEFVFPDSLKTIGEGAFNNTIFEYSKYDKLISSVVGNYYVHPLEKGGYRLHKGTRDTLFFRNDVTGEIKKITNPYCDCLKELFKEYDGLKKDSIVTYSYYVPVLKKVERTNDPDNRYSGVSEMNQDSVTAFGFEDDKISLSIAGNGNVVDCYWSEVLARVRLYVSGSTSKYYFSLRNKTENTLKVIWEDAVFVDVDETVHKVMHRGVKYADREEYKTSSSVIKGSKLSDVIIPSHFVRERDSDAGGWYVADDYNRDGSLDGAVVRIMIPIQIKNEINEYILDFSLVSVTDKEIVKVPYMPKIIR